jgi:hypothetical protein
MVVIKYSALKKFVLVLELNQMARPKEAANNLFARDTIQLAP